MTHPFTPEMKDRANKQAVLAIAGSDPSGSAGIQADLKTFTVIGVYGAAAITCLTAQNSQKVQSYRHIEPDFIKEQIKLVMADQMVTHIKTGMIGTAAIAQAIGDILKDFDGEIICDPVVHASDGYPLFEAKKIDILTNHLLNYATVLTPNIPELEMLSGINCSTSKASLTAAAILFKQFRHLQALVITGGHLNEKCGQITDFLILRTKTSTTPQIKIISHPRIKTSNTHGTGCTFASAFAAWHLLLENYEEAFVQSVSFIEKLVKKSISMGSGKAKGPLGHHLMLSQLCDNHSRKAL